MARPKGNLFELAYGHHRLEVLKQIFGDNYTIEVIVRNLNDDQMLQIMTNENKRLVWFICKQTRSYISS